MARVLIRNPLNNGWLKLEDLDAYVRSPENDKWLKLYPYNFSIRNSANTGWDEVTDIFDPDIDDPCALLNQGAANCNGKPSNRLAGSGMGNGSGGPVWDEVKGYPPGYDLPDASLSGFGLVENDRIPPLGIQIKRPGISLFESYDPVGVASKTGLGLYANPNIEWASVHGRGAAVTETVYAVGFETGFLELLYACYSPTGISIDVYYRGVRLASTCGPVLGRGRLKVPFESVEDDERIMIRVRGAEASLWSIQVKPQQVASYDDYQNLLLDYFQQYDILAQSDLLTIEYLGTPVFPAPCHATVWPMLDRLISNQYFEYYHYMGAEAGWAYLDYRSWANADFVEVYHAGKRIATTLDAQTDKGYLYFEYDPKDSEVYDLMVRVGNKDFAVGDATQSVYYSLYCVANRGAREFMHPCGAYEIDSAGHPTTEDVIDLTDIYIDDVCGCLIEIDAGSFSTKFEVFALENDELLDSASIKGRGTLEFWLPPGQRYKRKIYVRVTSAIGCDWRYFVRCPIQKPVIKVPDYNVQFLCEEPADINAATFDWQRVWHNAAGVTGDIDYEWEYSYEYAFLCSEVNNTVTAVGVMAVFEEIHAPWKNKLNVPVGASNAVSLWRSRSNLGGHATHTGSGKLHSIFRRRAKITDKTMASSNTWERVIGDVTHRELRHSAEFGYEYWIITDNSHVFSTRHLHLLKHWSTSSDWGAYNRTYCFHGDHGQYNMWASSDGVNVDRIKASYVYAVYEFEAPVTGTYRLVAWGNDDPQFGLYAGPFKGHAAHNYRNGDWEGYTKLWYEYFNDDDHYDEYNVSLTKGQKYTVRMACRNDNGGSAYIGLDICLIGVQSTGDSYNYGLVTATHLIAPDPAALAWALPTDGNSSKVAAVRNSEQMAVALRTITGAPDYIDAVGSRGNIQLPALAAIYRRPLFKSFSATDRGGWDIEYRAAAYAGSPNLVGVTDGTQKFERHKDYYVYAAQSISGVPEYNDFDIDGPAQAFSGRAVSPYRFLTDDPVGDVNGYTWPNMTSSNGGGGVVRLTGNVGCPHDVFHNGRFVAENAAQSLILILSRPCVIKR